MSHPRVHGGQQANAAQQAANDRQHATPHGGAHVPQHQGRRWGVPPQRPAAPARRGGPPLTGRRQAPRPFQAAAQAAGAGHEDGLQVDRHELDVDDHDLGKRLREAGGAGQFGERRGGDAQTGQLPLQSLWMKMAQRSDGDAPPKPSLKVRAGPKKLRQPPISQRLNALGIPGAAVLFGLGDKANAGPVESLSALASVVLSGARLAATQALPQLSLGRLVIGASWACLRRLGASQAGPDVAAPLSLGQVKQMLLDRQRALGSTNRPGAPVTAAVGDVYALLPLLMLNTNRPRTPGQWQIACDRQRGLLIGQDV